MKKKIILFLFILIIPFICINVDAREITQEEYMEIFENNISSEIILDNTFDYYLENSSARDIELQNKATSILANMDAYMAENELEYTFDSVEIQFIKDNPQFTRYVCSLNVDGTAIRSIYGNIIYKDYENYSEVDDELINSIFTDKTLRYNYAISMDEMSLLNNKWDLLERNPFNAEIDELIDGTGITYKILSDSFSRFSPTSAFISAPIYIFKNDVYYKTVNVYKNWEVTIDVPDEVEKTTEVYSDYAAEIVKNNTGVYPQSTVELVQATPSEMMHAYEYELLIDEMFYGTISVVNDDRVLLADNFQVDLNTSNEYVYAYVITEENTTDNYKDMVNHLIDNGFNKIVRAYSIIGNNNLRKAYFYFDNSFNGKKLRILDINNGFYQEIDSIVDNGMITTDIFMGDEVIIALKEEISGVISTRTFDDIINSISGYYSSEYTAYELDNIKNEIEKTIKEELFAAGINYRAEGYTISLENNDGWFMRITNKNGDVYKKDIYITPKKTLVEETGDKFFAPVALKTTNNTVRVAGRRYINTRNVESTNIEEDNALKSLEETIKKEDTKKKETTKSKEANEDIKKATAVKKTNSLPIKIIIGSVIILIIGGGVYYVRSRYY